MPLNAVVRDGNPSYALMSDDSKLRELALDVHHWQRRTVASWVAASAVVDLLFDSPMHGILVVDDTGTPDESIVLSKEWFLLNEEGFTTSMPTWYSYKDNWVRYERLINPFLIEWRNYDKPDDDGNPPLARELTQLYIGEVIDILNDQMELWDDGAFSQPPYATRSCATFQNFSAFLNSMQRLYDYVKGDDDSTIATSTTDAPGEDSWDSFTEQ